MLRRALGGIAVFAISSCFAFASQAQDIKLYAFSSGALTIGKGDLQNGAPMTPPIQVPVGFFVVKHPKGNVLFDTGNNDKIITDPSYWGPVHQGAEAGQHAGRRDRHAAAEDRPEARRHQVRRGRATCTSIMAATSASSRSRPSCVQKDEIQNAFWPEPGTGGPYMIGRRACRCARPTTDQPNAVKMVQLNGDLDLFGDGSWS